MSYLLDTNILRAPLNADPPPVLEAWLAERAADELYTAATVIGEIAHGIARLPAGRRRQAFEEWLQRLVETAFAGRILPFDQEAALAFGLLAAHAQASGETPGTEDIQIAAIALVNDMTLATRNQRHFRSFAALGLRLVDPFGARPMTEK